MRKTFNASFIAMLLLLTGWGYSAKASHYMGSEITYTCLGNHQYEIELSVYSDCSAIPPGNNANVTLSAATCGVSNITLALQLQSTTDVTPVCPTANTSCNGGSGTFGISRSIYKGVVTLPTGTSGGCSDWVASYNSCCRNAAPTSIANPTSQSHYIDAHINDANSFCNTSPRFLDDAPVKYACFNDTIMTSFAATDADGDSLVYSLVPVRGSGGAALTYVGSFSATTPFGGAAVLDAQSGALIVNAAPQQQVNPIAVKVEEYRNGVKIGEVTREVMYYLANCTNDVPRITAFNNNPATPVSANTFYVNFTVTGVDSLPLFFTIGDADAGQTLSATWAGLPATAITTMPMGHPFFFWVPTLADVGLHTIQLTISDDHCPNPGTSSYVIQINVTAPVVTPPTGATYTQYDTLVAGAVGSLCWDMSMLSGTPNASFLDTTLTNATFLGAVSNDCWAYRGDSIATDTMTMYLGMGGYIDTLHFIVTVEAGVWPGDTDTDQLVDNNDLLPIGVAYGATGTPRDTASILWNGYRATDWGQVTPGSAVDYKHIDADGNGVINADDTLAITLNWGNSYTFRNRGGVRGTIPFFVDASTPPTQHQAQLPLVLGTQAIPANGVYGLAFTLQYDTSLVKPGSVYVSFSNSWLGTLGTDMIEVQRDFYPDGIVKVAVTRTDGQNMNGFGPIGALGFTIQDDIMLQRGNMDFTFDLLDVRLINAQETELGTNPTTSTLSITTSTQELALDRVSVFPNPARDWLRIEAQNTVIEDIIMVTVAGQTVRTWHPASDQTTLSLDDVAPGLYILTIRTADGLLHKKVRID